MIEITCVNHGHLLMLADTAHLTDEEWAAILEAIQERGCEQCKAEAE